MTVTVAEPTDPSIAVAGPSDARMLGEVKPTPPGAANSFEASIDIEPASPVRATPSKNASPTLAQRSVRPAGKTL